MQHTQKDKLEFAANSKFIDSNSMNKKSIPNKLPYEEFKKIYSKVPRLCIDLLIKDERGILMSLRDINPGKGLWHLPGGTLLMGETVDEAIKRIAQEETSLTLYNPKLIGYVEYPQANNLFFHSFGLVFIIKQVKGELKGSFQGQNLQYFKKLPDKIFNEHKEFILVNQLI